MIYDKINKLKPAQKIKIVFKRTNYVQKNNKTQLKTAKNFSQMEIWN